MNFRLKHIAAGALLLGATAFALPASPVAADDDDFGAYIYETSCDNLDKDKIIKDIGDLDEESERSMEWQRLGQGADFPSALFAEDEDLDNLTLDDLTGSEHAVAVHAEDSKDADVIACGDIAGTVENGTLLIELNEVDSSGFEGRAYFAPEEDEDELEVTTGIWPAGEVPPLGTPEATPSS